MHNRIDETIIVKKRQRNFTMIDNNLIEDERLSFKAKGILIYLLSKPDNWKVIVGDIIKRSTDGERAIYSGLNELKKFGYYQKYPVREGQRIVRWESIVYECPEDFQEETKNKKQLKPMDKPENPLLCGFAHVENEDVQNSYNSNIYVNNTDFNNTDISIYQEKIKNETFEEKTLDNDMIDNSTIENSSNENNDIDYIYTQQELSEKLSFEEIHKNHPDCKEEIDMIFECICDVLTVNTYNDHMMYYRIARQEMPLNDVKTAYIKLEKKHIEYILDCLNKNNNKNNINNNSKSYIMTSLFNATKTISYYSNKNFKLKQRENSKLDDFLQKRFKERIKKSNTIDEIET